MELENTVVIVADLGELKAYKVVTHEGTDRNEMNRPQSLELINDESFISGRKSLGEMRSDSTGNFGKGTLEDHNAKTEKENRTIKEIAEDIDMIIQEIKPEQLFLAFPKAHNHELTDKLGHETKVVLVKNVAADLVKTDKNKILSHFA